MATNSPSSTRRLMSRRTLVRLPAGPYPLLTLRSSRKATVSSPLLLGGAQAALDHAHDAVQGEPDQADGDDAQDDVLVDQAVVLLPQEAADAGAAGQHLDGDDHQPGDPQAQAVSGKHRRQRRR